jgi:hypothetical protein
MSEMMFILKLFYTFIEISFNSFIIGLYHKIIHYSFLDGMGIIKTNQ